MAHRDPNTRVVATVVPHRLIDRIDQLKGPLTRSKYIALVLKDHVEGQEAELDNGERSADSPAA